MTQYDKILTALKKAGNRGMTNAELQQLWVTCPWRRISELISRGHNIRWTLKSHKGRWLACYKLIKQK